MPLSATPIAARTRQSKAASAPSPPPEESEMATTEQQQAPVTRAETPPPPASRKQRSGPKSKTSKYTGVTMYRKSGKFESHIWIRQTRSGSKGFQCHLGSYNSDVEAARAYDRAAIKTRGAIADELNFPLEDYQNDRFMMAHTKTDKLKFLDILKAEFAIKSSAATNTNQNRGALSRNRHQRRPSPSYSSSSEEDKSSDISDSDETYSSGGKRRHNAANERLSRTEERKKRVAAAASKRTRATATAAAMAINPTTAHGANLPLPTGFIPSPVPTASLQHYTTLNNNSSQKELAENLLITLTNPVMTHHQHAPVPSLGVGMNRIPSEPNLNLPMYTDLFLAGPGSNQGAMDDWLVGLGMDI